MGADAFIAYYGLRFVLEDDECEAVETRKDPRLIAARDAQLQTYWGRMTDGEPYFLLIGTEIGVFGIENRTDRTVRNPELHQIFAATREKLQTAGFAGEPELHLQLDAEY